MNKFCTLIFSKERERVVEREREKVGERVRVEKRGSRNKRIKSLAGEKGS